MWKQTIAQFTYLCSSQMFFTTHMSILTQQYTKTCLRYPSHSLLLNKYQFYSFFLLYSCALSNTTVWNHKQSSKKAISKQGHIQAITWLYGQHPTTLLSNWIIKQRGNNLQATSPDVVFGWSWFWFIALLQYKLRTSYTMRWWPESIV